MGFFDLNIPYNESSSSSDLKTTRIKIATKAMELGYSGIAYNRTIKGVMSDHDRCSISMLSLSSLQKLVPSLSSAVDFHRDLLRVPSSSPFRQYTRLTVCADSVAQAQVLNSGNSVIKTYDLVAVRPLNQNAFDYSCEKSEVDIISIDFSSKLPFRLKQPMVKAAIERGVYFEIIYSDLIGEVQVRRQMIANVKLLVDWTRGWNLISASAAPSVNELRGPYDVANLLSLIGVSMEQAKAAVSKNCRTLIANASQKTQFHKEAVKVEALPPIFSKEPSSEDLLKRDPISSGDGDLLLDDMAKSFAAHNVKVINFASICQAKDLLSAPKISSQSLNNGKNLLSTEVRKMSVRTGGVSKHGNKLDIFHQCGNSSKLCLPSNNTDVNADETVEHTGIRLQKCISNQPDAELANKNVDSDLLTHDMELDGVINDTIVTEKESTTRTTSTVEELKNRNNLDEYPSSKFNSKGGIPTLFANINDSNSLNKESKTAGKSEVILVEQNDDPLREVSMEETNDCESDCKADPPTLVQCVSGKSMAKQRKPQQVVLSPSKRLLTRPKTFKKKGHKFKRRT